MKKTTFLRSHAPFRTMAVLATVVLASACATKAPTIPSWGGTVPPVFNATPSPTVYQPAPVQHVATHQGSDASMGSNGRATFTQGCTGSYSQRDARTGRTIAQGRAYNSGNGLLGLDARGRRGGTLASNANISLLFLPDCNCRADGNQTGALPATYQFAITPPSAATCSAG